MLKCTMVGGNQMSELAYTEGYFTSAMQADSRQSCRDLCAGLFHSEIITKARELSAWYLDYFQNTYRAFPKHMVQEKKH